MKKHFFLGLAAGIKHPYKQLFTRGSLEDYQKLSDYLSERYDGEAMLCKNGRSALTLALKAYFTEGDEIIVNGFTCYAVYEAVKKAGLKPVFADITCDDLNYDISSLEKVVNNNTVGIIVQNTLGNMVDIKAIEKFAGRHGLVIIEDLAHCTGLKYEDGREAGTVGAGTVLSFGKDKSIDATSGGAVIFRDPRRHEIEAPSKNPKFSDSARERWYPVFGLWCRRLTRIKLGGALMRFLVKIHFVEKSADNRLDLERRLTKLEAKLALEQFKNLDDKKIREFYLVDDRDEVLQKLKNEGYYFDGFWYERPVSPERYYKKVHFNEEACPVAVEVSKKIVNLPSYYKRGDLRKARGIIMDKEEAR